MVPLSQSHKNSVMPLGAVSCFIVTTENQTVFIRNKSVVIHTKTKKIYLNLTNSHYYADTETSIEFGSQFCTKCYDSMYCLHAKLDQPPPWRNFQDGQCVEGVSWETWQMIQGRSTRSSHQKWLLGCHQVKIDRTFPDEWHGQSFSGNWKTAPTPWLRPANTE